MKKWRRRDLHAACRVGHHRDVRAAARDNAMLFAVRITRLASHKAFHTRRDAASDLKQRRAKVTAVVERWRRADTASAFEGWRAAARQKSQPNARALVWRVAHRSAARAFRAWALGATRSARQRAAAHAVLAPMLQRALAAAFRGWRFRTRDLAGALPWRTRGAPHGRAPNGSALARWRDAAAEAGVPRAGLRRVAEDGTDQAVRRVVGVGVVRVGAETRFVLLPRATRFAARRASERAETVWRAMVGRDARARFLSQTRGAPVSRIRHSVTSRAFDTWLDVLRERERHDALVARGRRRFNRSRFATL